MNYIKFDDTNLEIFIRLPQNDATLAIPSLQKAPKELWAITYIVRTLGISAFAGFLFTTIPASSLSI